MAEARQLSLRAPPTPRIGPQRETAKSYIRHNHMMAASTKKTTPKLLFRASVTWLTHPLPVPP